jgi:hypothetical protein
VARRRFATQKEMQSDRAELWTVEDVHRKWASPGDKPTTQPNLLSRRRRSPVSSPLCTLQRRPSPLSSPAPPISSFPFSSTAVAPPPLSFVLPYLLLPLPPRTTLRPVRSSATWRQLLLDGRRGSKDNAAAQGCCFFCFPSRLLVRETSQSSLSLLPIPHRSPTFSRCRSLWRPPQAI